MSKQKRKPKSEICLLCGTQHEIGEYKEYKEDSKTIASPPDIKCKCGLILRPVVPIISITASGYLLRPYGYHKEADKNLIKELRSKYIRE